jgi:hypothetical protein
MISAHSKNDRRTLETDLKRAQLAAWNPSIIRVLGHADTNDQSDAGVARSSG